MTSINQVSVTTAEVPMTAARQAAPVLREAGVGDRGEAAPIPFRWRGLERTSSSDIGEEPTNGDHPKNEVTVSYPSYSLILGTVS